MWNLVTNTYFVYKKKYLNINKYFLKFLLIHISVKVASIMIDNAIN